MNFRKHAEYKESGVEWLGKVPAHWDLKPLKHLAHINRNVLSESTDPDYEFDYIDIGSVSEGSGITKTERMKFSSAPSRARRLVQKGDAIVSTVRTYLRAIASVKGSAEDLVVSTGFCVVSPRDELKPAYCSYLLQASFFVETVVAQSVGVSYPATNASDIAKISISVPPLEDQKQIVTFLDRETESIDALVDKQEHLIALLREKRQAVISNAVTKGLTPNAKMKDSGVAWLGEVPAGWEVKRLKYSANLIMGQSPPSENYSNERIGLPFLQGCAEFGHNHPKPKQFCRTPTKVSPRGAILVSVRAPVGRLNFANQEYGIGRGLCAVVPNAHLIDTVFTYYQFAGSQDGLAIVSTGSTYDAVSVSDVGNLMFLLPPLEEQKQIAAFLDRETEKIDTLIEKCETAIGLLKERRTALISAAVTGKIDVRRTSEGANLA